MGVIALVARELLDPDVGENRQRALAGVLRAVRLAREESNENQELESLRELAAQLQADREERAAMESGVQRANQAPQLPSHGSGDPH
jgi:hypothetical protein